MLLMILYISLCLSSLNEDHQNSVPKQCAKTHFSWNRVSCNDSLIYSWWTYSSWCILTFYSQFSAIYKKIFNSFLLFMLMVKNISHRINLLIRMLDNSSRFIAPLFRDISYCLFFSLVLDITIFTSLQLLSVNS